MYDAVNFSLWFLTWGEKLRDKKIFKIEGMHCGSCEQLIEKTVRKIDGVHSVKARLPENIAAIEFNPNKVSEEKIINAINGMGYSCTGILGENEIQKSGFNWAGAFYILLGLAIVVFLAGILLFSGNNFSLQFPEINQNMALGAIFFIGILTSFHCIAMCGPFVVSYSANVENKALKLAKHFRYGVGKLISYTIIGGLFGLLGSFIAFTPTMRGLAGLIAGLFLIIYGLKMLNVFPILKKFQIPQPAFVSRFVEKNQKRGPFIIGLLNGLMIACGPLQAMYVLAAGTGSMVTGATYLFVFGLGTSPLMIMFGMAISFIGKALTFKIMKYSGIAVVFLGFLMLGNAVALMGIGLPEIGGSQAGNSNSKIVVLNQNNNNNLQVQEIRMTVNRQGYTPNKFLLKKGVKTKWIIDARELTSCNREIIVSSLNLNIKLRPGIQTIEFTPQQEGTINWSCWMGMLRGAFLVTNNSTGN